MTDTHDDELICAYIDNYMSPAERLDFQKRLEQSASLRDRLAQFEQVNYASSQAYDNLLDAPLPDKITKLLEPETAKLTIPINAFSLAASIALISVVVGLVFFQNQPSNLQIAIEQTLDKIPSTQWINLDEAGTQKMQISLSFKHQDGRFCREYLLVNKDETSSNIACKSKTWQVMLQAENQLSLTVENYQLASHTRSEAIETYLDLSMQGDGLDAQQEQIKIANGWQEK